MRLPLVRLAVIMFSAFASSAIVPAAPFAAAKEQAFVELRVATYNIHHGVGMDGVLDLDRIAGTLAAERPAIVALNEVDKGVPRSRRVDQARALAERLEMEFVFGPNIRYFGGEYGNAILTRFPVRYHRNLPLRAKGRERRGLLHAALDVEGVEVHVLTTHLESRDPAIRDAQIREIAEYAATLEGPVILMGDFNSDAGAGDPSEMLAPRFADAWDLAHGDSAEGAGGREGDHEIRGYTFRSNAPKRRIDYVFVSDAFRPAGKGSVRTVPSIASDHFPVVADLRFVPQENSVPDLPMEGKLT